MTVNSCSFRNISYLVELLKGFKVGSFVNIKLKNKLHKLLEGDIREKSMLLSWYFFFHFSLLISLRFPIFIPGAKTKDAVTRGLPFLNSSTLLYESACAFFIARVPSRSKVPLYTFPNPPVPTKRSRLKLLVALSSSSSWKRLNNIFSPSRRPTFPPKFVSS